VPAGQQERPDPDRALLATREVREERIAGVSVIRDGLLNKPDEIDPQAVSPRFRWTMAD
jgi:hypothetical protein